MIEQNMPHEGKPHESILECGASKWAALVDDMVVPMPRRTVPASLILTQAGKGEEVALVRDHNSPNDVVFGTDDDVDLGDGNVFYTVARCDLKPRGECHDVPKLAFFVNDAPEVVVRPEQSGKSLRELFGLPEHAVLTRDLEGPTDDDIGLDEAVPFTDGPVFYSRPNSQGMRVVTIHNEDNGVEIQIDVDHGTTIEEIIGQMYQAFGVERRNDDRLRCESDGEDVFRHVALTLREYVKAGHCRCLVWLFAGGTGGAAWL